MTFEDRDQHKGVLLRPDSEYAMGVTIGDYRPKRNKALATWVRTLYHKLLVKRKGNVKWSHVKGHSTHKWNDVVDELATRGTCVGAFGSTIPGKDWARTRLDGELHPIKTRLGMEAQLEIKISKQEEGWLVIESLKAAPEHIQTIRDKNTWIVQAAHSPQQYENLTCVEIMETERVMRSQNEIGTLNLIPLPNLSDTQISEAYEETVRLIAEDRNATSVRKAEATLKAHKAYKALEYTPHGEIK